MTKEEYLLLYAAEECLEIAHRICKSLRFTLMEIEPNQSKTNKERIMDEFADLLGVISRLQHEGILPKLTEEFADKVTEKATYKIDKWLQYSKSLGVISE